MYLISNTHWTWKIVQENQKEKNKTHVFLLGLLQSLWANHFTWPEINPNV